MFLGYFVQLPFFFFVHTGHKWLKMDQGKKNFRLVLLPPLVLLLVLYPVCTINKVINENKEVRNFREYFEKAL